jgi:hemerythrin-like metal-binding protein
MSLLIFNKKMELNIQSIDSQHQQWIELINKFNEVIQERQDKAIIYQALEDMLTYTRTHFMYEEQLLFTNGYPDFSNHKTLDITRN